jgi:cephalosporin-C deacetylase-like acetyl esterase
MSLSKMDITNFKIYLVPILIIFFFGSHSGFAQEENLNVLDQWVEWSNAENMLSLHINKQAFHYLDIREKEIDKLNTRSDWERRQKEIKETFLQIVGPLPVKTPLNPRVTGVIQKDGYTIEKIIFESMPNYYVSGCLFIPDEGGGRKPAILNVIGHTQIAFRTSKSDLYQPIILNLVKKGFIVFAIDPMGQGERIEYTIDEKIRIGLNIRRATSEHSYVNNQCLLSGYSAAKYWIWDGVRAVDYLLSREEVDPDRIGLTGLSGGGMATAYIAAFDERIKATAPAGYICGFRRLLESIGPQDGEQNFYHGLANGIDHADLIELFAPKPYLIVTTTRDFFSIQGARETLREVKKAYKAYEKEKNITMVEDDYEHGYTKQNREAIYEFFQRTLDLPGDPSDESLSYLKQDELKITETGQLLTSLGGESISTLNKKETEKLLVKLTDSQENVEEHLDLVRKKAMDLSGYVEPSENGAPVFRGKYQREGYDIEMYVLPGEGEYVIPMVLLLPEGGGKFPVVIYIQPLGKSEDIYVDGPMERLVNNGIIVTAPDLIGLGETKNSSNYPGRFGYGPALLGRSMVGIHAGDIVRVVNFLQNRNDVEKNKIGAVAFDELCPALLHAAAFESSISKTMLVAPPISYKEIVNHRVYNYSLSFVWGVSGALMAYDLPDLAGCIAPRDLVLINSKNNMKDNASQQLIDHELGFPRKVYALKNTENNLIIEKNQFNEYLDTLKNWWAD